MKFRVVSALLISAAVFVFAAARAWAAEDPAYVKTTQDRAAKIVATMSLADAAKANRVRDLIGQFYRDLNALQGSREAHVTEIKARGDAPEAREAAMKAARDDAEAKREGIRRAFLERLSAELTEQQVDQVKDGLTYGVVPLTFRVYQEMLPNLTDEQRAQIHAWLLEAREHAIAGFTSNEKHGWFGKYKGRINNYLSKAGYNMKQAEKEMMARKKKG